MSSTLNFARKIAVRFGYELRSLEPLDLRRRSNNLVGALYIAKGRQFVFEGRVIDCRSSAGYTYDSRSPHPLMRAASAYLNGDAKTYQTSPLRELQDHIRTIDPESPVSLAKNGILPWESTTKERKAQLAERRVLQENIVRGARLDYSHGGVGYRNMSDEKGEIEFAAIVRLVESIKSNGYQRNSGPDGDILALPLIRGTDSRFLIFSGKHRMAVVGALNLQVVPLRVNPARTVRREDAPHWPRVTDGYYSLHEATTLFDRVFDGQPRESALPDNWRRASASGGGEN